MADMRLTCSVGGDDFKKCLLSSVIDVRTGIIGIFMLLCWFKEVKEGVFVPAFSFSCYAGDVTDSHAKTRALLSSDWRTV